MEKEKLVHVDDLPDGFIGEAIMKDEKVMEVLQLMHRNGILIITPCRLKQLLTMMQQTLPPEIAGMLCQLVGINPLHIDVAIEHKCSKDKEGAGA